GPHLSGRPDRSPHRAVGPSPDLAAFRDGSTRDRRRHPGCRARRNDTLKRTPEQAATSFSGYSAPTWAPFSATERFMSSTKNTSATAKTAHSQKTSKYAKDAPCCWRRLSSTCTAICCDPAASPVCCKKTA